MPDVSEKAGGHSSPSAYAMDITPLRMWRLAQLGLYDQMLQCKAMWLCSLCYTWQEQCWKHVAMPIA